MPWKVMKWNIVIQPSVTVSDDLPNKFDARLLMKVWPNMQIFNAKYIWLVFE